ncbi:glycosyltransferase [Nonomuraea sediminis]|uniref:glycosyltransferase n=1 Tax=Nonomuraea sediminis TaxID=2835864 RepID=UPI001BDC94F2|nr:glycosyltransferase [Nonomuraea sediminis]
MTRIRVANVITRMTAGAGGVALRGALALDPDLYEVSFIAGGTGLDGTRGDSTAEKPEVLRGEEAVAAAPPADLIGEAFLAGMEVLQVPSLVPEISPRNDRAALRILTRVLAEGGYDVVHTHSAKGGVLGRLAAARAGTKRIVHTWHGFPFHDFQAAWRRDIYVRIERHCGKHTDAFLAVGAQVAVEAMRRRMGTADRIRTIPPAVDTYTYAPGNREQARALLDLPVGVRIVGTVGRVCFQKAPEHFIEALSKQPADVYGVWIGGGEDLDEMKALAERKGLGERMRWLGHRDDVVRLLPAFEVFAMASRYEGLPCVVIEAVNAGVPVVATSVNALSDVVVPGETGLLVPPARPAELAAAITYVLDHPSEGKRMAEAAKQRIGADYTPAALATVLDQVYRGPYRRPFQEGK